MKIMLGLRKTSLVDYPETLAAVFFLPSCNLRCPWCHNSELVLSGNGESQDLISLDQAMEHLHKRKNVLQGVVITGGEPSIHSYLGTLITEIKKLDYKVKLDTNGTRPNMLKDLFSSQNTRPDYIAMDLKRAPRFYADLSAAETQDNPGEALCKSAQLLKECGIPHEYRTLALPGAIPDKNELQELAELADMSPWYFTPFRSGTCLDPEWNNKNDCTKEETENMAAIARSMEKNGLTR